MVGFGNLLKYSEMSAFLSFKRLKLLKNEFLILTRATSLRMEFHYFNLLWNIEIGLGVSLFLNSELFHQIEVLSWKVCFYMN